MPTYLTSRQWGAQKAALTRAKKKGPESVRAAVVKILREWDDLGTPWPDDWAHLNRVLSDAYPWHSCPDVDELRSEI